MTSLRKKSYIATVKVWLGSLPPRLPRKYLVIASLSEELEDGQKSYPEFTVPLASCPPVPSHAYTCTELANSHSDPF